MPDTLADDGISPAAADLDYEARARLRWPDVPDCRDWLSLDRRGTWRIRGAPIRHQRTGEFLGRHYRADTDGAWFVQNGPQRAFVTLDAAPWILRISGNGALATHTGLAVRAPRELVVTECADLYVITEHGPGLLDDRDVAALADALTCAERDDAVVDGIDALLQAAVPGAPDRLLTWRGLNLRCRHLPDRSLEGEFGFRRHPAQAPAPPPETRPPAPK